MRYAMVTAENLSLGPAYIISFLRSQGHDVKLFFDPLKYDMEEYNVFKIREYRPDVVLFSCLTAHYQWALKMARQVKDMVDCKIVFGGIHPTTVPDVVRENKFIDDVCVGDGIKYFGGTFEPDRIFPEREDYFKVLPPIHRIHPYILTSFDCPFRCTYCGPKITMPRRSVDGCIEELAMLKRGGAKRFTIWDDVFTINKPWLFKFLSRYRKEINLPFKCISHVKFLNDEILKELKSAKCFSIDIGIQTGSEELRRTILNRYETNEEFLKACALIRKYKMSLFVDHIFGLPYDNDGYEQKSYNLYKQAKPSMVNGYGLVYFPKTKIIDHALEAGLLKQEDIPSIERGLLPKYTTVVNNKWLKKILVTPFKSKIWERLPTWFIKLALYLKIRQDFPIQFVIWDKIYFTWRRIWLAL